MLRILPVFGVLLSSAAWSQATQPTSDVPVRIGTFRGVERFEDPGHDVPGFHVERQFRGGLLIGGAAMFGGAFLFWLTSPFLPHDETDAIPFAGAFMSAAKYFDPATRARVFTGAPLLGIVALVSGAAQIVGAAMVTVGLAVPNVWLERDAPRVSVSFSPTGVQLRATY